MKMNYRVALMPALVRFFVLALLAWAAHPACAVGTGVEGKTEGEVSPSQRPPNVVIIFLDDSGWDDFQPFGETDYQTPHVESLAREGCRFDNFCVPQAVCSASRAVLLTGCYPGRTRIFNALLPRKRGLDPKFQTLAELLKPQGFVSACFGKWHIGDQPETRPLARGFDETCGLMVSNDM